jgi:hypothetical protein
MNKEEYRKLNNAVSKWAFKRDIYFNKKYNVFGLKPYWFIGIFCILFLLIISNR